MFGAWQGERFAREDKLKPLSQYQRQAKTKRRPSRRQRPAETLAVYEALASSGAPIKITRIVRGG